MWQILIVREPDPHTHLHQSDANCDEKIQYVSDPLILKFVFSKTGSNRCLRQYLIFSISFQKTLKKQFN